MSVTKAYDVVHVRFRLPDLERQADFLRDFGMVVSDPEGGRLFARGSGAAPFLYAAEQADEPGFAAVGMRLNSVEDLHRLAAHDGVAVEPLDAPGGGFVARLTTPDGYVVEAVAGQELRVAETYSMADWNHGGAYPRVAAFKRAEAGPSHVMRLGHVVLGVSDFRQSEAWFKERFGLITSDEIQPEPGHALGAFMRCDRGEEPCDHHTIFLAQLPRPPAYMHAAFEVRDLDDLMSGHEHLREKAYQHHWGIGRHVLGSQVFDYWLDPWGHELEHWTDGDQLAAADGGGVAGLKELLGVQWGMARPYGR